MALGKEHRAMCQLILNIKDAQLTKETNQEGFNFAAKWTEPWDVLLKKRKFCNSFLLEAFKVFLLQIALSPKTNIIHHVQPTLDWFCLEGKDVSMWLSGKFGSCDGNAIQNKTFLQLSRACSIRNHYLFKEAQNTTGHVCTYTVQSSFSKFLKLSWW